MANPRQFDINQGEENPYEYKNLPELNPSEQIEGVPDHKIIQFKANHAPEGMEMAIDVEEKPPANNDPEENLAVIGENVPERKESVCKQFMPLITAAVLGGICSLTDAYAEAHQTTEDTGYKIYGHVTMLAASWLLMAFGACTTQEKKTMAKAAFTNGLGTALTYAYSAMKDAHSPYIPLIIHTATGATATAIGSMCSFFSRPRRNVAPAQVALLAPPGPRN